MGAVRFDYAFREYIKRWAFKHPTPWDFFRSMENAAGEDLGWFWKSWFLENYKLDQAITTVENPEKASTVIIANLDQMAMPAYISYETVSGIKGTIKLPVEVWNNTATWKVKLPNKDALKKVILDADKIFPDLNRENNEWKAK